MKHLFTIACLAIGMAIANPSPSNQPAAELSQTLHIKEAAIKSVDLPQRGNVSGYWTRVDGSKIWAVVSVHPDGRAGTLPIPHGVTLEVWGRHGNAWGLIRRLTNDDCQAPKTYKLGDTCDEYFVAAFGTRDGKRFSLPPISQPFVAPADHQAAFFQGMFDATNLGDTSARLVKFHKSTNIDPLHHQTQAIAY